MRPTPNCGRENEFAVWLLLALCVRKMELLSARWDAFDLDAGICVDAALRGNWKPPGHEQ
jgi:integrase